MRHALGIFSWAGCFGRSTFADDTFSTAASAICTGFSSKYACLSAAVVQIRSRGLHVNIFCEVCVIVCASVCVQACMQKWAGDWCRIRLIFDMLFVIANQSQNKFRNNKARITIPNTHTKVSCPPTQSQTNRITLTDDDVSSPLAPSSLSTI